LRPRGSAGLPGPARVCTDRFRCDSLNLGGAALPVCPNNGQCVAAQYWRGFRGLCHGFSTDQPTERGHNPWVAAALVDAVRGRAQRFASAPRRATLIFHTNVPAALTNQAEVAI